MYVLGTRIAEQNYYDVQRYGGQAENYWAYARRPRTIKIRNAARRHSKHTVPVSTRLVYGLKASRVRQFVVSSGGRIVTCFRGSDVDAS